MKILGQTKGEQKATELDEISFLCSAQELKYMAHFLFDEALKLEKNGELYGHVHFQDESPVWEEGMCDLVVYNPDFAKNTEK